MSKFIPLLLIPFAAIAAPYTGDPKLLGEELQFLERLYEATEADLINQRHLKETLLTYRHELSLYLKNPSDKDLALKVSKTANRLLDEIKDNYLLESFESGFISELTLFAQLSQKKGIPKP